MEKQTESSVNQLSSAKTELKTEIIDFDSPSEKKTELSEGLQLLGELLSFLRTNKYMGLLMICRKINLITVKDGFVEIDSNDCEEIFENENYNEIIRNFFKKRNLDLKQKAKVKVENNEEKLNRLFGGKLIVKP